MTYAPNVLHDGVTFAEYIKAPGINASGLKEVARSPQHYLASLRREDKPTPAKQLGTLIHAAVLEPERFEKFATVKPDMDLRTKVGKEANAEWKASLTPESIEIPDADTLATLRRMIEKVHGYPAARRLLEKGKRETTLFWDDPRTHVLCKARPDFFSATGIPVDLKTARDARPDAFSKAVWEYRYDIQAVHYLGGFKTAGLSDGEEFAWLVIENEPPHEIAVFTAGISVMSIGKEWHDRAMDVYAECVKTGVWPGYERKANILSMPVWAKGVYDARDM